MQLISLEQDEEAMIPHEIDATNRRLVEAFDPGDARQLCGEVAAWREIQVWVRHLTGEGPATVRRNWQAAIAALAARPPDPPDPRGRRAVAPHPGVQKRAWLSLRLRRGVLATDHGARPLPASGGDPRAF